jgi:TonB family protein
MSQHADILDEREASLAGPLAGSLALHVGIIVIVSGFSWWARHNAVQWGTQNPLGGAIGVGVVDKIPLPNRSITPNLVANDTASSVPQKPEKVEKRKQVKEDEDAISLNSRKKLKRQPEQTAQLRKYQPVPDHPNQLHSTSGPAINSPMYGQKGIGGIGIGESTQAGRGCGGYLELVRQRIQGRWEAQPLSAGLRAGVIVNLDLQRSGVVRGVSILQSSGSSEIDFAARRAISEASPFQPFLPTCEGNDAKIEVRFEPKR